MSLIGTRSRKLNESGQGVIEYILVLTTTVFLIGTFLYQFSTAFRKYANNFFGEYVMCLMETGELPGQAKGQCQTLMTPFNLADGKSSTGKDVALAGGGVGSGEGGSGSGSGSGSGRGGSGGKNGRNGKNGSNGSDESGGSSGSTGASVGELGVTSGSRDDNGFGGRNARRSTPIKTSSGDGNDGGAGKGNRSGLKPVGAYVSNSGGSSSSDGRGKRKALDRGFGFMGQEERDRRAEERPATKAVAKDGGEGLRPKKTAVNATRKVASAKTDEESGFSIGNLLRIMMIAGILVAIFILFGGQLLAISKGGEK